MLKSSNDVVIQEKMKTLFRIEETYELTKPEKADVIIKSAFRGIDPWIEVQGKRMRLTQVRPKFGKKYFEVKAQMEEGWAIRFVS